MPLEVDCHSPQATLECPHQAGTGLELGTLFFFFFFHFYHFGQSRQVMSLPRVGISTDRSVADEELKRGEGRSRSR